MHRVCQQIIPRMLNEDQKAIRIEVAGDLISAVDKDPSLLGRIVIGDEKWCFLYDPQSKRASATQKFHNLHGNKNFAKIALKERSC